MNKGNGYYLLDADGESFALEEGADVGNLWSCTGTECQLVEDIPLGYLISKGGVTNKPYIKCVLNGASKECSLVDTSSDGTCDGIGKLYKNTGIYYVCLDTTGDTISVDLTTDVLGARKRSGDGEVDSQGQYMISIGSSLFGITAQENHFIVLDVDANGNVIVVKGIFNIYIFFFHILI